MGANPDQSQAAGTTPRQQLKDTRSTRAHAAAKQQSTWVWLYNVRKTGFTAAQRSNHQLSTLCNKMHVLEG
jgi:hypothetical protein